MQPLFATRVESVLFWCNNRWVCRKRKRGQGGPGLWCGSQRAERSTLGWQRSRLCAERKRPLDVPRAGLEPGSLGKRGAPCPAPLAVRMRVQAAGGGAFPWQRAAPPRPGSCGRPQPGCPPRQRWTAAARPEVRGGGGGETGDGGRLPPPPCCWAGSRRLRSVQVRRERSGGSGPSAPGGTRGGRRNNAGCGRAEPGSCGYGRPVLAVRAERSFSLRVFLGCWANNATSFTFIFNFFLFFIFLAANPPALIPPYRLYGVTYFPASPIKACAPFALLLAMRPLWDYLLNAGRGTRCLLFLEGIFALQASIKKRRISKLKQKYQTKLPKQCYTLVL